MPRQLNFKHRHKEFFLRLSDEGTLELYVDNCLRKQRLRGEREPQYVWTNVELEWEEHHYIEARYWSSSDRLLVTVNSETIYDQPVGNL